MVKYYSPPIFSFSHTYIIRANVRSYLAVREGLEQSASLGSGTLRASLAKFSAAGKWRVKPVSREEKRPFLFRKGGFFCVGAFEHSVDLMCRPRRKSAQNSVKGLLSVTAWQDFFVSVDTPQRYRCVSGCLRLETTFPSQPKSSEEELSLSHWHLVNENLRCYNSQAVCRVALGELL